jgi:hypothetical protein
MAPLISTRSLMLYITTDPVSYRMSRPLPFLNLWKMLCSYPFEVGNSSPRTEKERRLRSALRHTVMPAWLGVYSHR